MIVPMVKYSMLVYHKDYEVFLNGLQKLSLLHITEKKIEHESLNIISVQEEISECKKCIKTIKTKGLKGLLPKENKKPESVIKEIKSYTKLLPELIKLRNSFLAEKNQLLPWGIYSEELIQKLNHTGIELKFFKVRARRFNPKWEKKYCLQIIKQSAKTTFFVIAIKKEEPLDIPLKALSILPKNIKTINQEISLLNEQIKETERKFDLFDLNYLPDLEEYIKELNARLEFFQVMEIHSQNISENKIKLLEGWIPESEEQELHNYLEQGKIIFVSRQVSETDKPPIKLINKRFFSLFESTAELFSMPDYRELDLTPFFAPFFLLFFGLCIGDSGYGFILLIAATLFKFKVKTKYKQHLSLVQILGAASILTGLISGTFIGIELSKIQYLKGVKDLFLDSSQTFNLALYIGGVQIIFGLIVKAANLTKQRGIIYAISTFSWILLILSLVTINIPLIKSLDYFNIIEISAKAISVISVLAILFYNDPQASIPVRFGKGLWNVYTMVTGIFGDLLSYIRLFALGIASSILGLVVNQMAIQFGKAPYIGSFLFIIVLLFGHFINLSIALLGAYVHTMRLTFVEFYKNAGFTGGGKKYKPFGGQNG